MPSSDSEGPSTPAAGTGGGRVSAEAGQVQPGAGYPGRELMLLLQSFTTETDRYIDAMGRRYGMHRTDLMALSAVLEAQREGRTVTPGILSAQLSLSSAATTALVDRLGKVGHMVRERSGTDRRQVQLEITDSARTTGAEIFSPMVEELIQVVSRHSPEEIELLSTFMAELRDGLVRAREKAVRQEPSSSGSAAASSGS
jgi:DNA-binding MarR family transcriptional regulator